MVKEVVDEVESAANRAEIYLEQAEAAAEAMRKLYGDFLTPLQNGIFIDVVPKGVNKAEGMYRVMEFFGGTYEDVITVGDNINDTDMLREFRSYAMESGVESVKALADGIVSNVTEIFEKEVMLPSKSTVPNTTDTLSTSS